MDQSRLGGMLIDADLITQEQLKMAVDFQRSVGGKLGAVITKLGFIEEGVLTNFIARQQDLPLVNLSELVLPENLVRRMPQNLIEKHIVFPIRYKDGVLTIATSDPFDFEAMEELQLAVDHKVEIRLAPRSQILKCITEVLHKEVEEPKPEKSKEELLKELEAEERTPERISPRHLREALIPLLVEKGIIKQEELEKKARELLGL